MALIYAKRLALVGLLSSVCSLSAWAQQGHEVIFIVDQSGSMQKAHGPNGTWAPNDPLGNRVEAIMQGYETIQNLLDINQASGLTHRIHVIEFGSTARRRSDLSISMTYDPAAPPGRINSLKNRIRTGLLGVNLGNTDTKAAFEEAQKLIATLGPTSPDRLHIILITDGKPDVDRPGQPIPTGQGSPYQHEMDNVLSALRQHATLDVIGITGNGLDVYWPTWGPYWTQVSSGRAFAGSKGTEVSMLVDRVLRERLGLTAQTLAGNPYYCPPYLRYITFTVFKNQRGGRAQIKDALGIPVVAGRPGVNYINEVTYDRITIEDPPPGLWELDQLAAKITVDMLYKQVDRLEPKSSVNAQVPIKFSYKVLSDRQQPFQLLPNYPVQASLQVTDPNGHQTNVALTHQGQGVFTADSVFQFPSDGTAQLLMTGTTVLPDQSTVTVFNKAENLTVTNKNLLVLNSGATLPGEAVLHFGRMTARPVLSLQRFPTGQTMPPATISPRPNDLLEFRLIRRDGSPITEWRKMVVSGDNFMAEAAVRVPILSLDWLRRHDEVFAEVKVNEGALNSDFAVRELKRDTPEPTINRDAALPALRDNPLAVPLVLGESIWTFGLILGLAALLVSLITHWGYRYLRKLCYYVGDTWIWRQRVTLVVKPSFQEEVLKSITNDYRFSWKTPAVKIKVGDENNPDWKPAWLKVKRLFRPWVGEMVVKVKYPVTAGKKENKRSVVLTAATTSQDGSPTIIAGVPALVEALIRVKRRGKNSTAQTF